MKKSIRKIISLVLILTGTAAASFSFDLTFRISPAMMIPTQTFYKPSFSGAVQADADLFGFLTAGLEGIFTVETPNQMSQSLSAVGGGIGIGAYYYPFSRLHIGGGAAIGLYSASMKIDRAGSEKDDVNFSDFYWRAYAEAGFRINPTVTVNGFGGFASYNVNGSNPVASGPFFGVSARIAITVGKSGSSGFRVNIDQPSPAYPLFMGVYKDNGFALASITNLEGAEITDVKISFRAGKYTSETKICDEISRINKYGTVEVPVTASFSPEILKFSENGKISGELVIDYRLLGTKKQSVQNIIVDVYNRNSFSWDDAAALSAFISPDVPEILEFSKYVAGVARNGYRTGISRNLEMAAAMTEALALSGVKFTKDQTTPYTEFHASPELDSIQHALQTMNFLGGDYDDLGILLASCLESVGVPTGYLICDDDFIVLVDLQVSPTSAGNHFGDPETLVTDDTTAYFGLSMKNFSAGFIGSMRAAQNTIKRANNEEIYAEYISTHEAWDFYPPVIYSGANGLFRNPIQSQLELAYKNALDTYSNTEISRVLANAKASGDPNKIGLALVRIGRYAEAKNEFAKSNSTTAMNNLASVYVIEENYDAAIKQYMKVLERDPENVTAKKGIDKAKSLKGL